MDSQHVKYFSSFSCTINKVSREVYVDSCIDFLLSALYHNVSNKNWDMFVAFKMFVILFSTVT